MTWTRRAGACAAGVLLGALLCPAAGSATPVPEPAPDVAVPAAASATTETAPPVVAEEEEEEESPDPAATGSVPPVVSMPPAAYVAAGVPATVPVTVQGAGSATITVDPSGLTGVATWTTGPDCPAEAGVIACERPVLTVRALPRARIGATGRLVVTVSGDGFPAVVASTAVTVVPKVALAGGGPARTTVSRRAGGRFAVPLLVRNAGATVIDGVTLEFPTGPYHRVAERFANCWYGERVGWCRIAAELRPGTTYAPSVPVRMRVRPDFPAPGDIESLSFRWRIGEAGEGRAVRGRGRTLGLVPVEAAGRGGPARTRVTVRVTGSRTAGLRALAGPVSGDVGSTVTAVVGVRNTGPVFLRGDHGAPAVVAVTPPPGTTVRSVPRGCAVTDEAKRLYHCVPAGVDPFEPGSELTWRFRLRIDRADERSGWVGVRGSHEEPLLDDNLAPLTVTTASGSGGGAAIDATGLPVTGPPVAALTAVGLLFVAAGAAMYRAAR